MRVYHERLRVPLSWWLLGLAVIVLLGTEVVAGFSWLVAVIVYVVLTGGLAATLVSWGRPAVVVTDKDLWAGAACVPLAAVGEVAALDEAQTRSLRGPRADPAAFLMTRPYLRRAVYVELAQPGAESRRPRVHRPGVRAGLAHQAAGSPYWLVGTRHPEDLATAVDRARAAMPAGGATMG
jgi:hypothetical protein